MTPSPEQTESLSQYGRSLVDLVRGKVDFAIDLIFYSEGSVREKDQLDVAAMQRGIARETRRLVAPSDLI